MVKKYLAQKKREGFSPAFLTYLMKSLDKFRQPIELVFVVGEVVVGMHIVNVVPLNIDWDSSLDCPIQHCFRLSKRSVSVFALVITKTPIGG